MKWIDELKYDDKGLIPAIMQDEKDGQILMVAWMNRDSIVDTMKTGKAHFWSRSRQKYWMKGEESGNTQEIKNVYYDCDRDVLLFKINQVGNAACHTGHRSCFFTEVKDGEPVENGEKVFDPKEVYGK